MAKHRQGFVSNSSSSSFIIASDSKEGKIRAVIEADISRFSTRISTKEELEAHIISEYGYGEDPLKTALEEEWLLDNYHESLAQIHLGKTIFWGHASYNETEDPVEYLIGNGGLNCLQDIEVIYDEN